MHKKIVLWIWIGTILFALGTGFGIGRWSDLGASNPSASFTSSTAAAWPEVRISRLGSTPSKGLATEVDFQRFWDLWQLLKQKYYQQPIKDETLFYGAMIGMASSVGDPYTAFFEPKTAQEFQQALEGRFQGIGAEIGIKENQLQVISPLPETPAERAGLLAGDAIVKIDDRETLNMTVEEAVSLIRGPKGTKVTLTVFRSAQRKPPFEVVILRDEILIKSVTWKMLPRQIALIEVTHFNDDTADRFRAIAEAATRKNPKAIILDLRNNPGGFLDAALDMAGAWVGSEAVVKERRQGQVVEVLHGTSRPILAGIPTVVLVNQGSASASEIVAGALQDHKQATLIGTKTFGKGSVQDYRNFDDGSGVKITIAEWITPRERAINTLGLSPDILVDRTPEDYAADRDPQLDRAISLLLGENSSTSSAAGAIAP